MTSSSEIKSESNQQGIGFLNTELDLANTFLDIAKTFSQRSHREQNHRDALTAYRSILHFLPRTQFTPTEASEFNQRLEHLRTRLVGAGISIESTTE